MRVVSGVGAVALRQLLPRPAGGRWSSRIAATATIWFVSTTAFAQTAVVTRNVHLRPDSSTEKPSIRLLTAPTQLHLLNPEHEDGFFNVRTGGAGGLGLGEEPENRGGVLARRSRDRRCHLTDLDEAAA